MPALVVAVVAAAAAWGAGAVVGGGVLGALVGALAGAVVAYAGNMLVASISGTGKRRQDATTSAADAKRTIRSEVAPRRIVYGQARVSGPLIYAGSFGGNREYLLLVIPLCDHEIEAVDAVWLGEHRIDASQIGPTGDVIAGYFHRPAPPANIFNPNPPVIPPLVSIRRLLGNQTQADPQLVAECPDGWRAQDRLAGIAHLVVRLRYDADLFQGGVPSISAEIRGKRVFDPRSGTTVYSDNWALCIHDYLRATHGIAAAPEEIDADSIIAAANLSDEAVQILPDGTTQPRYTLNGTFTLDEQPIDVLEGMLAAGCGALVYTTGQYRLFGGAYQAPAVTLTESDFASDVEVVTQPPRRELFNSVRGNFIDPNAYWQAHPFPPIEWEPYLTADGEQIWRELELPWVLEGVRAQRIAKQLLLRARQGVTIRAAVKYAQLDRSVWQTVGVTLESLGWEEKPFRVIGWSFSPETGLITLTMQEEQVASYAWWWDEARYVPEHPDTTLATPFDVPAPAGLGMAEALYVTRDGAGVRTKALLTWVPPALPFVTGYDIEYRPAEEEAWRASASSAEPRAEVLDLAAGTWDFRVRARTSLAAGAWAYLRAVVGGLAAQPPLAVTGLSISTIGGFAFLRWDRSPDLDVRVGGRFEIRHTPDPHTPSWAGATSIGEAVSGEATSTVLPLKPGTYFLRPVDASGIYGDAVSIGTVQATALAFANVDSVVEHTAFSGAKTGTVVTAGTLRLEGSGLLDDAPDFDAIADLDWLGGFLPAGSYAFSGGIDLGAVRGIRLTSHLLATIDNANDQWDDRVDIDSWATVDGVFGGEADAWVESRATNDNPGGSPAWGPWQRLDSAEFSARAFQFRAELRSHDPAFNVRVSELSVSADEVA